MRGKGWKSVVGNGRLLFFLFAIGLGIVYFLVGMWWASYPSVKAALFVGGAALVVFGVVFGALYLRRS